jgi:hypothetical protein
MPELQFNRVGGGHDRKSDSGGKHKGADGCTYVQ